MKQSRKTAVIVVDMLTAYDYEDADRVAESAKTAIPAIRTLIDRAGTEGAELIYVNDNYGDWDSSREKLQKAALDGRHPELVEPILPPGSVDFVLKARHTIFYGTPLEYLLYTKEVGRLVLAGQVTEQCILYSALDAYVRHYDVVIPKDAVAHIHEDLADAALEMMRRNMHAEISDAAACDLSAS